MNRHDLEQLFAYTEWANALALDAAEKLTHAQLTENRGISHGSILGTLAHMAAAEWVWLERWHGHSHGPDAFNQWSTHPDVAALRAAWQAVIVARQTWLASLMEEDLARDLTFKRLDGTENTLPLGQQMQHVVNHATLHRGQVVGMIRQLGITPPATDLLFYLRRPQA